MTNEKDFQNKVVDGLAADSSRRLGLEGAFRMSRLAVDSSRRLGLEGAFGESRLAVDSSRRIGLEGAFRMSRLAVESSRRLGLEGAFGESRLAVDSSRRLGLEGAFRMSRLAVDSSRRLGLEGAFGMSRLAVDSSRRLGYSKNLLDPKLFVYQPVIKELSLNDERVELRYIEDKIPNNKFNVTHAFNSEKDSLEYKLENEDSNEAIPIQELTSTLAITDVFSNLTMNEVVSFYSHLAKRPMLGLLHPVGQLILDEITNVQMVEVKDLQIYRVRKRSQIDRQIPFVDSEMFEAPHGYATQGRFNYQGHGELYVCDNKNVAIREVISKENELRYEIIEWKLEESVKLIDLSNINSPLAKYCSFHKTTPNGQEYLIPNFIAQCAKYQKISGIRYNSVHDNEALNYVFFDFEEKWFNTAHLDVDLDLEFLEGCIGQ